MRPLSISSSTDPLHVRSRSSYHCRQFIDLVDPSRNHRMSITEKVGFHDLTDMQPDLVRLTRDELRDHVQESDTASVVIAMVSRLLPDSARRIRALACCARLIVLLGPDSRLTTQSKWWLMAAGATDVLDWPGRGQLAACIVPRINRLSEIETLIDDACVHGIVVGQSAAWRHLLRQVVEIASFSEAGLLLTGETGTGKEQIARLVHALDRRPSKADLVVVDCTTLSRELSGSELFGHERGAFTGAIAPRDGAIALAHRGTIFLDEIGELELPLQAQLLRVIQERSFKRVGSNVWQQADFRLICATSRELELEVRERRFRADLYYRIADHTLHLPPLRERRDDILPLSRHFWCQGEARGDTPLFDPALEQFLLTREYPGNVRDLRRIALALRARHVGPGAVSLGALPNYERPLSATTEADGEAPQLVSPTGLLANPSFVNAIEIAIADGIGLKDIRRAASSVAIRMVLEQENGNLQRAARRLGVTDRALQMRRANDDMARS
jgi:transcriptional regulator with GAF, ATPase, and Fis domain